MKEFMMLFMGGDYSELSPEEVERRMQLWQVWMADLRKKDLYLNGRALQPGAKRVKGDVGDVVTDGPFVEAKELVGGYIVFKANDIKHALSLTDGYPDFDLGGEVEVREIWNIS